MNWPSSFVNKVVCADALDGLRQIPEGVIQCCVTSPPYWGLRDYGLEPIVWGGDNGCKHEWGDKIDSGRNDSNRDKMEWTTGGNPAAKIKSERAYQGQVCSHCSAWRGNLGLEPTPELYVEHLVEVFREVRRVLRDDGTLWLNLGDSYVSGRGRYSSVSQTISGHSRNEPVDGNRPDLAGHPTLKDKDLCGIPWSVAFALRDDGWWLRQDIIWAKGCSGEYMGGSVMPESIEDRCTKSHEYLFILSKSANYYYDHEAIKEDSIDPESISGRRPRNPRQADQSGDKLLVQNIWKVKDPISKRNRRSVWVINPEPTPYAHFATFPQKLVEPCIMAGTSEKGNCGKCGKPWVRVVEHRRMNRTELPKDDPRHRPNQYRGAHSQFKGDMGADAGYTETKTTGWMASCSCFVDPVPPIVLDPFSGSATVGVVAKRLLRNYVLIDLSAEYNEKIAKPRLAQGEMQLK